MNRIVVDADELLDEMFSTAKQTTQELGKVDGFTGEELEHLYKVIGLAALKYFMLKVDPKKKMLFDPKESIDFNGQIVSATGTYNHTTISSIGCDSVVTLDLTVLPINTETVFDTICEGDLYDFNGNILSTSGVNGISRANIFSAQ